VTEIYSLATLWLGLALIATLLSIWLRMATAMSEIIVGTVAQLIIGAALGAAALGTDQSWVKFLASIGAMILTFLAGAELDPNVMRREWKQATIVGLVAFTAPFLGCAAVARYGIGWSTEASWLTGIALSTTSVAVVYAVMLEFGLNRTEYGKIVLAACFVNDLATVLGLGLMFSPFNSKTVVFVAASTALLSFSRGSSPVSSAAMAAVPPSSRRNCCFWRCLGSARWRCGPAVSPCFRRTSWG